MSQKKTVVRLAMTQTPDPDFSYNEPNNICRVGAFLQPYTSFLKIQNVRYLYGPFGWTDLPNYHSSSWTEVDGTRFEGVICNPRTMPDYQDGTMFHLKLEVVWEGEGGLSVGATIGHSHTYRGGAASPKLFAQVGILVPSTLEVVSAKFQVRETQITSPWAEVILDYPNHTQRPLDPHFHVTPVAQGSSDTPHDSRDGDTRIWAMNMDNYNTQLGFVGRITIN